jgi:hypothetical protein
MYTFQARDLRTFSESWIESDSYVVTPLLSLPPIPPPYPSPLSLPPFSKVYRTEHQVLMHAVHELFD